MLASRLAKVEPELGVPLGFTLEPLPKLLPPPPNEPTRFWPPKDEPPELIPLYPPEPP